MTLTEFLLARITEDEAVAVRLCPGRSPDNGHWNANSFEFDGVHDRPTTKHIVRHDPARVLAECEAKRKIVELYDLRMSEPSPWDDKSEFTPMPLGGNGPETYYEVIQLLASVYADHPDYLPEWAL